MTDAWRTIERHYVNQDVVTNQSMAYGAIAGMVNTLDDPQHTRFMTPEEAEQHRQFSQGQFEGTVILVNAGTASGAEIVTGAMQDHGRAVVVGTTTAGAGTVLNAFELQDGSVMVLAVEEWRTPDGRIIWHEGLAPDITMVLPPDTDPIYPRHLTGLTAEEFQALNDLQLERAIEVLTNGD